MSPGTRGARAAAGLLVLALAACAGGGGGDAQPRTYDFGIDVPAAKLPSLRLGQVRAAAPLDSHDMYYRLAFRNAAELSAFAHSRWAAPPAELMRRRLGRAALGAAPGRCTLDLELHELSQVFASPDASEALLEAGAVLYDGGRRIAERVLRVAEPGAGSSAAAGAAALARAADRAIAEIGTWVAQQRECRSP